MTAIDVDRRVLDEARDGSSSRIRWICGDVMGYPFERASFDVVASVATLHHLGDPAQALQRCADLTAPGGALIVVGLARASRMREDILHLAGAVQHRVLVSRHGWWEHTAPTVWPPPHTYREVHAAASRVLPGCRWRLLPMWRYSLVWRKPPAGASHQMHH